MRAYIFWFVGGAVVCALVLRGFRAKWRMQQRLRHYQASSTAATVAAEGENGQRCDGSHFSGRPVCNACHTKMYGAARKQESERPEAAPNISSLSSASAAAAAASVTAALASQTEPVFRSIERSRRLRPNNPPLQECSMLMFWKQ